MGFIIAAVVLGILLEGCQQSIDCDWKTQVYDGQSMKCVERSVENSNKSGERVWYDLDHGSCVVHSHSNSMLNFSFTADAGLLYAAAPHREILAPKEASLFSDLSIYEGNQLVVIVHLGNKTIAHLGTMINGTLVGERIKGDDISAMQESDDCVLGEVQPLTTLSAVATGNCQYDGDGQMVMGIDMQRVFNQDLKANFSDVNTNIFVGMNAASYDEDGNFELFVVSGMNETHISGEVYYSTRVGTWSTILGAGEAVAQPCSVLVDPAAPPSCSRHSGGVDHWRVYSDDGFGMGTSYKNTPTIQSLGIDVENVAHGTSIVWGCVDPWTYSGGLEKLTLKCLNGNWQLTNPQAYGRCQKETLPAPQCKAGTLTTGFRFDFYSGCSGFGCSKTHPVTNYHKNWLPPADCDMSRTGGVCEIHPGGEAWIHQDGLLSYPVGEVEGLCFTAGGLDIRQCTRC